jgi:hypothetical protein
LTEKEKTKKKPKKKFITIFVKTAMKTGIHIQPAPAI